MLEGNEQRQKQEVGRTGGTAMGKKASFNRDGWVQTTLDKVKELAIQQAHSFSPSALSILPRDQHMFCPFMLILYPHRNFISWKMPLTTCLLTSCSGCFGPPLWHCLQPTPVGSSFPLCLSWIPQCILPISLSGPAWTRQNVNFRRPAFWECFGYLSAAGSFDFAQTCPFLYYSPDDPFSLLLL